ncbi:MAG: nucleoside-diphosphate kinase [Candidatus Eisenbacteria bacterium]
MSPDASIAFLMIKPCAVADGHIGDIVAALECAGFSVAGIASRKLTAAEASLLYDVHEGKPFFGPLVDFITSGMTVGLLLSGPGIPALRKLIGATDPSKAEPGTIRALYGRSLRENAVHASDSNERIEHEARCYFEDCPRTLTADVLQDVGGADREDR